jgi:ArsR family transcriptional regulator
MNYECCKNKKYNISSFLKIISEENRLKILCILNKEKEICVCHILEQLQLPQNLVSHHLKTLKDFNLIQARKEGRWMYYSINKKEINKNIKLLDKILK